jgi:hypothetical protein
MKIEFVKEQKLDGTITYYSQIDGFYVSDSLSFDEDKAYERYKRLVEANGEKKVIEVIESIEL